MAEFTEFNRIGVRTVEARGTDGNIVLYTQCSTYLDGTPMNDSKVDGDVYIKVGYEYFKRNDTNSEIFYDDATFVSHSFNDGIIDPVNPNNNTSFTNNAFDI